MNYFLLCDLSNIDFELFKPKYKFSRCTITFSHISDMSPHQYVKQKQYHSHVVKCAPVNHKTTSLMASNLSYVSHLVYESFIVYAGEKKKQKSHKKRGEQ